MVYIFVYKKNKMQLAERKGLEKYAKMIGRPSNI